MPELIFKLDDEKIQFKVWVEVIKEVGLCKKDKEKHDMMVLIQDYENMKEYVI